MGGGHLLIHRYQWFDRQVRAGKFPNATSLAEKFEISVKTAQRNIESLRERLEAPLEYDPSSKGYYYSDTNFQLVTPDITQEEMLAILVAQNILSASAGGVISQEIKSFGKKLFGSPELLGLSQKKLNDSFSSTWSEYAPAQGAVFQAAMRALLENKLLAFSYTSPKEPEPTLREIEPHHLQHYMGNWIIVGYCHLRQDWRKFKLSRMLDVKVSKKAFSPRPKSQWKYQLEGGFGIFQGSNTQLIKLKFNAFRAPWIREQIWHDDQSIELLPDGKLILSFPACQYHEVKMKILQFGADVEVLEPEDLRDEIKREASRLSRLYLKK
ncbi:WYL domain-containing protein [uncultured Desulfuromusa sp.]|uniref:helix-turn-helix transcriptional regulator n=1 Tax=uncultured Desulfuromusa sp. TaxID=219183 RepID=UPI002AA6F974|nr:WYL domain-containing protein [uncultured Desulfuromusa sp.]